MPNRPVTLNELPPPPTGKTGWPWTEAGSPAAFGAGPRVTVVTPSFNQAAFLEEAIRSVLLQGYPDLEYFVIDGGSTDGSVDIIRRYAPWLAGWTSARDAGQAAALAHGFQQATGAVLAWLNSDDVFLPGAVTRAAHALRQAPEAVMVYGDADQIDAGGVRLGPAPQVRAGNRRVLLEENNTIAQPAAFFRRTAYAAVGGLDPALHWAMDYDLWIKLAGLGALQYLPVRLAQMRLYPQAKTGGGDVAMFAEILTVVRRHGGTRLPAGMSEWLEAMQMPRILAAYRTGDDTTGRQALRFVVENVPAWQSEARLADTLAGEAWRQVSAHPETLPQARSWIDGLCRDLPLPVRGPRVARQALALVHEALAFQHASAGRPRAALGHATRAARLNARRALNRGLWSAVVRAGVRAARPRRAHPNSS
jgi:hypothetical protein